MLLSLLCLGGYLFRNYKDILLKSLASFVLPGVKFLTGRPSRKRKSLQSAKTMSLEDRFRAAVKVIQSLPKDGPYQPSNSTKLRFYSLFKQGTEGRVNCDQPSFFSIVSRAKWDAWNKLGDMSKEVAMLEYIEELKKIIETMSFSGDVQEFLETLGPFYEFVNLEGREMDHVKRSLDEWTSSSSSLSSSLSSSAQTTPIKHIHSDESEETYLERKEERLAEMNGLGFESTVVKSKSNGHLPNYDFQTEPPVSSRYSPPSAPVHHRTSIPNGHAVNGSGSGLSLEVETSDEILKVDVTDEGVGDSFQHFDLDSRVSLETMHSGTTDSDKYYSGDSEPDLEASGSTSSATFVGEPFPSHLNGSNSGVSVLANSNGYVRMGRARSNHYMDSSGEQLVQAHHQQHLSLSPQRYGTSDSVDLILQSTVDRLNRDVDHILARLRILETAYSTSAQFPNGSVQTEQRVRRRPFGEISKSTLTLIFAWPFVAYFIIKLVKLWLNRRRRVR